MKPNELKEWMARNKKTAVDVASATHVSPKTVERFLRGETDPIPTVMEKFEQLVQAPVSGAV